MIAGGIIVLIFYNVELVQVLLCGIGGVMVSGYLIFVSDLMYSEKVNLNLEEEVVGVISIYTDVINVGKQLVLRWKHRGDKKEV